MSKIKNIVNHRTKYKHITCNIRLQHITNISKTICCDSFAMTYVRVKCLNPISPGLFGGLITRGGGVQSPPPL